MSGECPSGKRPYATWSTAARMARNTNRDRDSAHVQPYHCRSCHRFHVGGSDWMRPRGKLKQR